MTMHEFTIRANHVAVEFSGGNVWSLEEYDWDPATGVATLTYEKRETGERAVHTKFQRTWYLPPETR